MYFYSVWLLAAHFFYYYYGKERKKMKTTKLIIYATTALLTIQTGFLCASSSAASDDISVIINNKEVVFDVPPQIRNERTMVPVRAIFETLGASVDWNADNQTITSKKNDTTVVLKINSHTMYINGNPVSLDTPACIIDERTLVPVRAVSEAFNTSVNWDGDTRTVIIKNTQSANKANIETVVTPSPSPEPTVAHEETEESKPVQEYKYYTNSKLITYNSFCDVRMVKVKYAYHYFPYNKDEFNSYIELLTSEGWTITPKKKRKKDDVYATNENGERARILYNSSQVVIVTDEKYINFPSGTILNESGEQIKAILNEVDKYKSEEKNTDAKQPTMDEREAFIRQQAEDAYRRILNLNNSSASTASGAVIAEAEAARRNYLAKYGLE